MPRDLHNRPQGREFVVGELEVGKRWDDWVQQRCGNTTSICRIIKIRHLYIEAGARPREKQTVKLRHMEIIATGRKDLVRQKLQGGSIRRRLVCGEESIPLVVGSNSIHQAAMANMTNTPIFTRRFMFVSGWREWNAAEY